MNLDKLPKPFFVLAPMDDVTDSVFRQIVAETAKPDLFFTEFVNVDGLQSAGREHLLHKLMLTDKEKPVIAQLWGLNPENFYKTVKEIVDGSLLAEANELRAKDRDAMQGRSETRSETYNVVRRASTGASDEAVRSERGGMPGFARQPANAVFSFAGVDLNMGCPVKTVIKNGACAALINNRELAGEIIDATIEAVTINHPSTTQAAAVQGESEDRNEAVHRSTANEDRSSQRSNVAASTGGAAGFAGRQASAMRGARALPVSVKTRVGFTTVDLTWIEFLLSKILDMLSIHGRTAKQMSKVPADWDLIGQAVELRNSLSPSTLIVGNGDIQSRRQAEDLAEKYHLDGIMIGRGIFHDPFIFAKDSPWEQWGKEQRLELFAKHIQLYIDTYKDNERHFEALRKFCKVYINGFDGAADLRAEFMQTKTPQAALSLLKR